MPGSEFEEEQKQLLHETIMKAADEMDARLIAGEPFEVAVVPYRAIARPAVYRFMAAQERELYRIGPYNPENNWIKNETGEIVYGPEEPE